MTDLPDLTIDKMGDIPMVVHDCVGYIPDACTGVLVIDGEHVRPDGEKGRTGVAFGPLDLCNMDAIVDMCAEMEIPSTAAVISWIWLTESAFKKGTYDKEITEAIAGFAKAQLFGKMGAHTQTFGILAQGNPPKGVIRPLGITGVGEGEKFQIPTDHLCFTREDYAFLNGLDVDKDWTWDETGEKRIHKEDL